MLQLGNGCSVKSKKCQTLLVVISVSPNLLARIFFGGFTIFLEKVDDLFLVVALKTQAKR